MHRILKPKNIRRLINLLALIAPIVYLFATQIFALAGAHGEEVFSQPVYTQGYVSTNFVKQDRQYRLTVDSFEDILIPYIPRTFDFSFDYNGSTYQSFNVALSSSGDPRVYVWTPFTQLAIVINGVYSQSASSFVFTFTGSNVSSSFYSYVGGSLEVLEDIPTGTVAENNSAYTDYLFGNFFMKDNFLEKFGSDSLNDEYGFKPMNDLLSVVDSVADIGGTQLGRMAYGYLAYCGYVLLLNLVAGVLVFFFTWPDLIMDKLHGGID